MRRKSARIAGIIAVLAMVPSLAGAEILAMINYESKPPDALKPFRHPVDGQIRRAGIAIIHIDPHSKNFGTILMDIPLPPDLVAHYILYNQGATKAYVTAIVKMATG